MFFMGPALGLHVDLSLVGRIVNRSHTSKGYLRKSKGFLLPNIANSLNGSDLPEKSDRGIFEH
jgi:hypothetical protein